MVKNYNLSKNIKLEINLENYKTEILTALKNYLIEFYKNNFQYKPEDDNNCDCFWKLANNILTYELNKTFKENLFEIEQYFDIDNVLDKLYYDLKEYSKTIL